MTKQPEALRVAHELECRALINEISLDDDFVMELDAARLLREQHAEIERLKIERKEDQGVIATWRGRTLRAEAEIERLRADAERYRYLRNRDPDEVFNKSGKAAGVWIDWEDDTAGLQLLTGDDADAAIDAATAEERKP